MENLEIYIDPFSQPCRAVMIFCELQNIPYTYKKISLAQLEHKSPEFKQNVNPLGTIPALIDKQNNVKIAESHAIMRYLSNKYQKFDFYPGNQDPKKTAYIDFYLDWHLNHLRAILYPYLRGTYILSKFGVKLNYDLEKIYEQDIPKLFKTLEKSFINKADKFIFGNDTLTIADISLYCEIYQYFYTENQAKKQNFLEKYPRIQNYLEKVRNSNQIFEKMDKIMIEQITLLTQALGGDPKL